MNRLLIKIIKHSKATLFLFIAALLIILVFLPFAFQSLQDVRSETETNVTHYARGSYDLLIRPAGSEDILEQEKGIVHENYIGFGQGGISISEWETIKDHSEIDIAAPVASLGYFTGLKNLYVNGHPTQSTRVTSQPFTSDGMNRYPLEEELVCTLLEFKEPQFESANDRFDPLFENDKLVFPFNFCNERGAYFEIPSTYHVVVAIDPEHEEMLTGISFPRIAGDPPSTGWGADYARQNNLSSEIIPIMELQDEGLSLEIDSKIETLDITKEQVQELMIRHQVGPDVRRITLSDGTVEEAPEMFYGLKYRDEQLFQELVDEAAETPVEDTYISTDDIGSIMRPFEQDRSVIIEPYQEPRIRSDDDDNVIVAFDISGSSLYYTADNLKYEEKDGKLYLPVLSHHKYDAPSYRKIEEHGENMVETVQAGGEPPFILNPSGGFSVKEHEDTLAASPLGIYQLAPVHYIGGDEEVELKPTTTPGSFITPAASGVVNIEHAELIKGEDPIDAIRVRVAGIDDYTQSAAQKIERLAEEFREQGFHVNIIAGASPQHIEVDVEGIGLVRETWTTLGAAGEIIDQWNMTTMLLGIAFLFVALSYVVNRMRFWQITKREDILLYYDLGWDQKNQLKLFRRELLVIWAVALLLAIPFNMVMDYQFGLGQQIYVWLGISVLSTLFILLALLVFRFRQVYKKEPDHKVTSTNKNIGLIGKGILYFRSHIFPPFVQILLVSVLLPFIYLAITDTVELTSTTFLGDYINMQMDDIHFILMIATIILTLFTLFESLSSILMVRREEIILLNDMGWNNLNIASLYIREAAVWLFVSVFLGHISSFLLYINFYQYSISAIIVMLVSLITIFLMTLIITSFIINRYISKAKA